jgi:transcriptional regulator with XRE-family HTH domain
MVTDLKLQRMKAGLKQLEVAKFTGIDRSRLSLIENSWIEPKPEELQKINAVLHAKSR